MTSAATARSVEASARRAADPQYVQYAVDDLPVRIVMLDTLVPGAARHAERRATRIAGSDTGRRTGQADDDRHASSALRLRHRPHGPDQPAQRGGIHSGGRPPSAGRADHLWPSPSLDRYAGRACDRLDLSVGRASGGDVVRIRTILAPSCSSPRLPASSLDRRPTESCRTPFMWRISRGRMRS